MDGYCLAVTIHIIYKYSRLMYILKLFQALLFVFMERRMYRFGTAYNMYNVDQI